MMKLMESCNNSSAVNFTEELKFNTLDVHISVIVGAILGFIIFGTIFGNILVLLAVYYNTHLRNTTNYFIVNLAVADLLLGISVLPFSATLEILGYWPFERQFCEIWAAVDVLLCTASITTLCVISVDRYIGVTRPLRHSTIMSETRASIIIAVVWILSLTISLGPLLGWRKEPDPDPRLCIVNDDKGYVIFSAVFSFYIPMIIVVLLYYRIYREAVKHTNCLLSGVKTSKYHESSKITLRVHMGRSSSHSVVQSVPCKTNGNSDHVMYFSSRPNFKQNISNKIAKFKREKKAAKTLGIVVGVFVLCWFPFFFCLPLGALCRICEIPEMLFKIAFWLGYCNSMINPIIYACSSKEFKNAYCRIIKCRCRQRRRHLGKCSMNTSFCELKGSCHGSPRHHNVNYHKNCVEFKTGDENINLYQYTNGTTQPNYKEVSSTTLKSDYDDYNSGNYDQDQIDALRIEQMERNYNSYNMISNV